MATVNENLKAFATAFESITGVTIGVDHIHEGTGRYYYIQPTEKGSPMLLCHYRGPLFMDIHPDDLKAITTGTVDPEEYIKSSNWLVGYFWGGGSMVGGGYYQPIDICNRQEDLKRYLRILACRTHRSSSGYFPKEDSCNACSIENCPFCPYGCKHGKFEDEAIQEKDPRHDLFNALKCKFENEFPGYTLRGFLTTFEDNGIDQDVALVRANSRWDEKDPYSFTVWVDSTTIRGILSHTLQISDYDEFVKNFKFKITEYGEEGHPEATMEHIQAIFKKPGKDRPTEVAKEEAAKAAEEARVAAEAKAAEEARITARARWGIFGFVFDWFNK